MENTREPESTWIWPLRCNTFWAKKALEGENGSHPVCKITENEEGVQIFVDATVKDGKLGIGAIAWKVGEEWVTDG